MGQKKNVDMSANTDKVKIVSSEDIAPVAATASDDAAQAAPAPKAKVVARSKRYQDARSKVDRTKFYEPSAAVDLVKELSYSKFAGTITADIVTKDQTSIDLTLPNATGKTVRVAVADDALLTDLEAGKIEFDILVTSRQFVPKLAKYARVLGPRGLMPNPKNGTITENPEAKKKELESGAMTYKTEKKQPVMHISIGKTDMKTADVVANLEALMNALVNKVVRLSISATMSPSVKVKLG